MAYRKLGCLCESEAQTARRDFLKVGSLGFLGMTLGQTLALEAAPAATMGTKAKAKSCILLWLEGGPAQMDTWDPKTNSSFRPISTNVAGIQDKSGKVLSSVTASEVQAMIDDGTISGGMLPKVECALSAVRGGARTAVIVDGRVDHAVLLEVLTDEGVGTMISGE